MTDYQTLVKEGERSLLAASQMVTVTYPLVHAPKIFLPVVEHICEAFRKVILACVASASLSASSFSVAYHLFKTRLASQYGVESALPIFEEAEHALVQHQESDVEFVRAEKLLMYSHGYTSSHVLDILSVRKYLSAAHMFLVYLSKQLGVAVQC